LNCDITQLRTPCYVIDRGRLRENLGVLARVRREAECKILLALKGFAAWGVFDLVREALNGAAASSLFEARLGREAIEGEVHLCGPVYREDEFDELLGWVDHVVFNSLGQWKRFGERVTAGGKDIRCGLRVNPEHSEVKTAIYDPCAAQSRLGITREQFPDELPEGITGLHFHTLCELNSDELERTLGAVEEKFGGYFGRLKWVNFGGGHHITREDYGVERLVDLVRGFREMYEVEVYLEPGEAVALNAGILVASVLDTVHNQGDIAILDTSAAAHMPDVLEMPYRPEVRGAGAPGEKRYTYRLAGMTCLAGDVIGDYSFETRLEVGDKLVFEDMAHYTMVKNTLFNGINLPDIVIYEPETGELRVQRRFTYEDYKSRLS